MRPADTSPQAHAAQIEFYRRLGPEKRLELALRMSDEIREVAADGIRSRHPEYSDREVRLALLRLVLGDGLFRVAYPHAQLLDP